MGYMSVSPEITSPKSLAYIDLAHSARLAHLGLIVLVPQSIPDRRSGISKKLARMKPDQVRFRPAFD